MATVKYREIPSLSPKDIARFWDCVDRKSENECWLWNAACTGLMNYGVIHIGGVAGANYLVHRIAFVLGGGGDPGDLLVCHICDAPKCCNPKHLFKGTHKENSDDKIAKGRAGMHKLKGRINLATSGERQAGSKLSAVDVYFMREMYSSGRWTQRELSVIFSVESSSTCHILQGRSWKHVPMPHPFKKMRLTGRHWQRESIYPTTPSTAA